MMRLDKLLAHSGYGTRKEVKLLIREGLVSVNGELIYDDDFKVDEINDEIFVEGYQVDYKETVYLMLNKPKGVISATFDNSHQTVIDLIGNIKGTFPVGRLDIDTEGLLLITNDGKLGHALLSPKNGIVKKYYVNFIGRLPLDATKRFESGIVLEDNYKCLPALYEPINDHSGYVSIQEGKFHQIKRMLKVLGVEVSYLKRLTMGPLVLDETLKPGEYRELELEEINILKNI